jgi:hypothetical protein
VGVTGASPGFGASPFPPKIASRTSFAPFPPLRFRYFARCLPRDLPAAFRAFSPFHEIAPRPAIPRVPIASPLQRDNAPDAVALPDLFDDAKRFGCCHLALLGVSISENTDTMAYRFFHSVESKNVRNYGGETGILQKPL